MAQREFTAEAGAALVFLIGYVGIFLWMGWHYYTHALKWKSRWSMLLFHVMIRMGSQGCGIGFSILGLSNTGLFLAFLILGAEGYFTLVICAFRFLISWHRSNLPNHISWLEPPPKGRAGRNKWMDWSSPMFWFHNALILANTSIIIGGSFLSNADYDDLDGPDTVRRLKVAKIARTGGQSVFLACNAFLIFSIVSTMLKDRRHVHSRGAGKIHPTLWLLFVAWFPLIVRGVWGVLQSADFDYSYTNPGNYNAHGFTERFSTLENVLGVLTEFLSCLLFVLSYYPSRADNYKDQISEVHSLRPLV